MKKSGVVVLSLGLGQTALEAHWRPLVTATCVYSQPVHKWQREFAGYQQVKSGAKRMLNLGIALVVSILQPTHLKKA